MIILDKVKATPDISAYNTIATFSSLYEVSSYFNGINIPVIPILIEDIISVSFGYPYHYQQIIAIDLKRILICD